MVRSQFEYDRLTDSDDDNRIQCRRCDEVYEGDDAEEWIGMVCPACDVGMTREAYEERRDRIKASVKQRGEHPVFVPPQGCKQ